jgi:ABC-type lipoprotein release transport system permease subunit
MLLILPLADSEFLLRTEGQVHYIACSSPSAEDVEKMTDDLEPHISKQGLVFLDWKKLIPDLLEFLALDSFFGYIFLGIILTVVVFGILTGIITSVLERTGEFGILIAIGTRPIQIVRLILYESIVITGAGSLLGLGTGLPLAKWLTYNPIELPLSSADVMASYGMENLLHFFVYPEKIALIIAFLFTISILMSLAPAIRAGLLKPYIAIREARR